MSVGSPVLCARRRRALAIAGAAGVLAILAGTLRAADQPPPPSPPSLDQIKNELQAVKRAENAGGDGTASLTKVALPAFPATAETTPEAAPPPHPAAGPVSLAPNSGRDASQPNWLVDAMLPRDSATGGDRSDAGFREQAPDTRGGKDPAATRGIRPPSASGADFLLNIYLSQLPADRSRTAPSQAWEFDSATPGDLGSFSRFLGDWVSPRDPALRGLIAAASPDTPGAVPLVEHLASRPGTGDLPDAAPVNPYLEALAPDLTAMPSGVSLAPVPAPPSLVTSAPPPPAAPSPNLPPPNPADEKKYFPQLNRF